jgi:hypothetical protein
MFRLVTSLVVLAIFCFGADRVASTLVARSVARELRSAQSLSVPPTVSFVDVPFLDQLASGRYTQVEVRMSGVRTSGPLVLDHLSATLHGVRANTMDVVKGQLRELPIDYGQAEVFVSFPSLNAAAQKYIGGRGSQVTLARASADSIALTARVNTSAGSHTVRGETRLTVEKGLIKLTVLPQTLTGVPDALRSQVATQVDLSELVPKLPYGLRAGTVVIEPEGLRLQAAGENLRIPV